MNPGKRLQVRRLGLQHYQPVFAAMRAFTDQRDDTSVDQLWLLEHLPVYTLGLNRNREHILAAGDIEVVESNRGGEVTYHGPGQLVAYALMDTRRKRLTVKRFVANLEQVIIDVLAELGVGARRRPGAPGVYVEGSKIAALGIRMRGGCTYHGIALNVDMDLSPFAGINPCGYPDLGITQLADLGFALNTGQVAERFIRQFLGQFDYDQFLVTESKEFPKRRRRHAA